MFIGCVRCLKCGIQNIENAETITIWISEDSALRDVQTVCPSCGDTIDGKLTKDEADYYKSVGVNILQFGQQFEPLTEQLIASWDPNDELYLLEEWADD